MVMRQLARNEEIERLILTCLLSDMILNKKY